MPSTDNRPILVTAAGGTVGGVSTFVVEMLRKKNIPVRALVRREDARAEEIRKTGAEVVVGDLNVFEDVKRVLKGCRSIYFSYPVKSTFLEASLLVTHVAREYGVEVFVNMSQIQLGNRMSFDSIIETSPQTKAHWLACQTLNYSGIPWVDIRPNFFLEVPHFVLFTKDSIINNNELRLPFTNDAPMSPLAAYDIARVIVAILLNPAPHVGKGYTLVGNLQTFEEIAKEYSIGLGRPIKFKYQDPQDWLKNTAGPLLAKGIVDQHLIDHLYSGITVQPSGAFSVENNVVEEITGTPPMSVSHWVRENANLFK